MLVLELDLTGGVAEAAPLHPLRRLAGRRQVVLREVVEALRLAERDDHVSGVVVRVGGHPLGIASAQELRGAIARLRSAGKWSIAWSESFGEFSGATVPYYLATGCDEVWLQPTGDLGLVGVSAEVTFLAGALERAGVEVQIEARKEFKNAPNQLTEHGFTPAHREATGRLVESVFGRILEDVAAARQLTVEQVAAAIDEAPLPAAEALRRRLVDHIGYRDEVYDSLRGRDRETVRLMYADRYRQHALRKRALTRPGPRRQPTIAMVDVVGAIHLGHTTHGPMSGANAGADTVTGAIRAALRDDSVRAVVLRVDSPGGSAVASDSIWRAVQVARAAGKPVVASMGDYAASGGYYVSVPADAIVAQPSTITGSIGVFGGKPVLREALGRLGVTTDAVAMGEHSRMFSTRVPWSQSDWQRVQEFLDRVYADFTARVADGRGLSPAEVEDIARGRVWTGADAHDRQLVDRLGGIDEAVDLARELAKLREGKGVVREFPRVSPLARMRPPSSSEDPVAAAAAIGEPWGGLAGAAQRLGLPAAGPLVLPMRLSCS